MISGLPQQGQPLDLQYVSELAQSIIYLNEAVSSKSYSKSLVRNFDGTLKNDKTSNVSFYASYHAVVVDSVAAGDTKTFRHDFSSSFASSPVVTATPLSSGKTTTGHNLSVVITEITPGSVAGVIKFNNTIAGSVIVGVNIIAIGFQGKI